MKTARTLSAALLLAGTALCACSGDDNAASPPPLLDAGSTPDATGMPADGSTPTESGSGGGPTAPPCASLPGTIVYVESGDTQEALLKHLGRELRDTANVTLVFWLTGSCTLTPNLYNGTPIAAGQVMQYIPSTAEDMAWTPAKAERSCTVGTPTIPDLGISALYPASCQLGGPDAGSSIGLIDGPVQAYTFIVPTNAFDAHGRAILAQEAHDAFGANKGTEQVMYKGAAEWNDPSQMFFRPTTKSTLVSTAFNIQLTAGVMARGAKQEPASSDVLSAVIAANSATSGATRADVIGILGDEVYDTQGRGPVSVLAFQAFGQNHAYFPDSTETAFDKQNIRDGHYTMWSPTVYITEIDGSGEPVNPVTRYITGIVTGSSAAMPPDGGAPIDGIADVTAVGLTPSCAMQVTRTTPQDGAALSAAAQPPTCTCYFLSKIPNASGVPANCTACGDGGSCPSGQTCLRGFCEGPGAGIPPAPDGGAGCDSTILNACTNAQAIDKTGIAYGDAGP